MAFRTKKGFGCWLLRELTNVYISCILISVAVRRRYLPVVAGIGGIKFFRCGMFYIVLKTDVSEDCVCPLPHSENRKTDEIRN